MSKMEGQPSYFVCGQCAQEWVAPNPSEERDLCRACQEQDDHFDNWLKERGN